MYMYFNNNPLGRRTVGDCSVRAISKALGVSWDEAHDMLADMSFPFQFLRLLILLSTHLSFYQTILLTPF